MRPTRAHNRAVSHQIVDWLIWAMVVAAATQQLWSWI